MSKPVIKILVSCHKPVCTPRGDMFVPVHVGAAGKKAIAGYQPDNEGDNISDRNFSFCEMSGQYWAWKNLQADYVGQCHYRRYFCFTDEKFETNDHAQIEDECLSPLSIAKYHIADEAAIASAVEGVDIIRAPYWCVRGVPTPDGPKKTIRAHMVAYGLMTNSEVDRLVELCREVQPEYVDELEAYLGGNKYLGYNCFIMKRSYFDQLCEFEFSILRKFDAGYDYSHKTVTHKRICGYLGEILYSVFIAHAAKNGAKIAERRLVFFDETPAPSIAPSNKEDVLEIVWRYTETTPAKFVIAVESLLRVLDPSRRYRLTLVHNAYFKMADFKKLLGGLPTNLEFVDATFPVLDFKAYAERLSEQEAHILLPFLLPQICAFDVADGGKLLWIEGCALFQDDPAGLMANFDAPIGAAKSMFLAKELNKPKNSAMREAYVASSAKWETFEASCMIMNIAKFNTANVDLFELYCSCCAELGIDPNGELKTEFKKYRAHKKKPGTTKDTFCMPVSVYAVRSLMLKKLGAVELSFDQAYSVIGDEDFFTWANEEVVAEYKTAQPGNILLYAPEATPFTDPENPYCMKYWALARQSAAYEPLLMTLTEFRPLGLKRTLFPEGTKRYKMAFKLISKLRALR